MRLHNAEQRLDFICYIIEAQLVGVFASADSKLQANLSYTIQELLRIAGFTDDIVMTPIEALPVSSKRSKSESSPSPAKPAALAHKTPGNGNRLAKGVTALPVTFSGNMVCTVAAAAGACDDGMTMAYQNALKGKWMTFPKSVMQIVRPLLNAKYSISTSTSRVKVSPLYPAFLRFNDWLHAWMHYLVEKVESTEAKQRFVACLSQCVARF